MTQKPHNSLNQQITDLILDNIEDGIFVIDHNQQLVFINQGGLNIIEASTNELKLNRPWTETLKFVNQHNLAVQDLDNPLKQIWIHQQSIRQDAYLLTFKDHNTPIHLIISPIFDNQQQLIAVVGVIREMSLEKQQEQAKTDFVSTASHEMRTPLATLEGYLSLLSKQDLNNQAKIYVSKAHQTVLHLGKLFKDLLTTSQSEDGQLSHKPQIIDLLDLMTTSFNNHQASANEKSITLRFEKPSAFKQGWFIYADPKRIAEVVDNLLENALKYTSADGFITLNLEEVDDFFQLQIKDTGLGISQKDLPHIFQKFYRIDDSQPGTGLGLFICKKIVELYKGAIWLESNLDQGTTFYVNLPKHESG
ncbi:MAG: PAS domain-containing sensor histidine kinase [Candidatus Saccharibacteria bacterium]|nr:PAS domain-containing sensor histidine kinase [Candidatus Saccharibacteria bacterium]